jgi:hypothetical protein
MSSQGIKFMKSVFSTMNYLLYGPIALTGTRPLTRPFIQRLRGTKGGQMENVSCFYSYAAFERDRNNELNARYTVKKVSGFPVPSRDVTNETLPGSEELNYSPSGRVWLVTSRLGTENG